MLLRSDACRSKHAAARHEGSFQARLADLQDASAFHSRTLRLEEIKRQIASAGSKLMADPMENLSQLRLLLELGLDSDSQVDLPSCDVCRCSSRIWIIWQMRNSRA